MLCKNYKPLDDFGQDTRRRDGKQCRCKICSNLHRRKERKDGGDDAEENENATHNEEPPRKRSKGEDLYVFNNSRLPEYKIGRSGDTAARSNGLEASQNFYMLRVAIFEGKGHLEDTVREMLAYCLLSREVAAGTVARLFAADGAGSHRPCDRQRERPAMRPARHGARSEAGRPTESLHSV